MAPVKRSSLVALLLGCATLTTAGPGGAAAAGPEVHGPAVPGPAVLARALPAAEVRGRLLGPSGAALPGARVELLPVLPNFEAGRLTLAGLAAPEPVAGCETGADGRFAMPSPAPGHYAVRATAPGLVPVSFQPLPVVETVDLPPVRLHRDEGVRLTLTSPAGPLAAGAWVFAESEAEELWRQLAGEGWLPAFRKARTDAAGGVRLPRAAGETLRVTAFAAGLPPKTLTGVGAEGATLTLVAGHRREIEVTDEAGRPLAEVLVRTGLLAWPAGLTGPDGRLAVHASPGDPLLLSLSDSSGRQRWFELPSTAGQTEPVSVALPPALALEGRVVEADGAAPVAGALVWAPADPGIFRLSDRSGRFRLPAPPDGRLVLRAAAAGYLPARSRLAGFELTRGRAPDFELEPALRVVGRLVDPHGSAEAEATVERVTRRADAGTVPRTASAGDGRFELAPLPAEDTTLLVRKDGRAPLTLRLRPEKGRRAIDLGTLVLQPEAAVLGQVLDPAGRPVPGAEIRSVTGPNAAAEARASRFPDAHAVADAEGWFRVGERAAGEVLTLLVQARGFAPARLPGVEPPLARPLTVVLEPGWEIRGQVFDAEGGSVAGAEVQVTWRPLPGSASEEPAPRGSRALEDVAGEDGSFAVAGVAPGLVRVEVTAAGYAPAPPQEVEVPRGEAPAPLTVVLARGASLEGRVATTVGQPLAGVRIGCDHADAVSDADGRYHLADLPFGPVEVAAYHPDLGRRLHRVEVTTSSQRLDWIFEPGVEVSGRVHDRTGAPVTGAVVELLPVSGWAGGRYEAKSGLDGAFTLAPVVAGRYRLHAARAGFAEAGPAAPVVVRSEPVEGLEVHLVPAASISGRILGLDLHELARVRVEARDAGEREHAGWVGSSGDYEIEDVAPGEWVVIADLDGGRRQASVLLHVTAGERSVRLDLEFAPGLALTGELVRGGAPLAGALVSLAGPAPELRRTVGSNHLGEFRFSDLEPGHYRLAVTHAEALLVHTQSFDLEGDAHLRLDLATARVQGKVVAATTAEPLAAAVVTLHRLPSAPGEEEFLLSGGTDGDGLFDLARVPPGRYRLAVRRQGFEEVGADLEVATGEDVLDLEVELSAAAPPPR